MDFEERREEHYKTLKLPLDGKETIFELKKELDELLRVLRILKK